MMSVIILLCFCIYVYISIDSVLHLRVFFRSPILLLFITKGYAFALEAYIFTQTTITIQYLIERTKKTIDSLSCSFKYICIQHDGYRREKVRKIYNKEEEEEDDDVNGGGTNDILLFFFLYVMTHSIVYVQSFHKRIRRKKKRLTLSLVGQGK
jgi:hypothetical protein